MHRQPDEYIRPNVQLRFILPCGSLLKFFNNSIAYLLLLLLLLFGVLLLLLFCCCCFLLFVFCFLFFFVVVVFFVHFFLDFLFALFKDNLVDIGLCCRPWCLRTFPVWCFGKGVEFDCVGSWSLPFHVVSLGAGPDVLAHLRRRFTRWAYSIPMVRRPSVRRRPSSSTLSNLNISQGSCPILIKFYV